MLQTAVSTYHMLPARGLLASLFPNRMWIIENTTESSCILESSKPEKTKLKWNATVHALRLCFPSPKVQPWLEALRHEDIVKLLQISQTLNVWCIYLYICLMFMVIAGKYTINWVSGYMMYVQRKSMQSINGSCRVPLVKPNGKRLGSTLFPGFFWQATSKLTWIPVP